MKAPPIVLELEYRHLDLSEDESNAIDRWVRAFIRARESGLYERCQQLLVGIKGKELSIRSQGLIVRCRALLEQIQEKRVEAIRDFQRSLDLLVDADDLLTAGRVCNDLGTMYQSRGDYTSAAEQYRQALVYWLPGWQGTPEEAMVRNNLGVSLADSGLPVEAIQELEIAAKLYRQVGYPQGEARVLINLGRQYRRAGKTEKAKTTYEVALEILRQYDDKRPIVDVLNSLGIVHRYLGDFALTIDYYTRSMQLAQELDDLDGQAQALNNLGNIYQVQEDNERARYFYQEALRLCELLGDISGQAKAWGNIGDTQSADDENKEKALASYEKGLALYQKIRDIEGEALAYMNIAGIYRYQKHYNQAESLFCKALKIGKQLQNVRIQDFSLCALGTIRLNQKRWDESEKFLREALELQKQRQDQHAQVETMYKLSLLAYNQSEYEKVQDILTPAWEMSLEGKYARWIYEIAWLIGDSTLQQKNLGGYNYYATALVFAEHYQDTVRYNRGIKELTTKIHQMVQSGYKDSAILVCNQLIDHLQKVDMKQWSQPVTDTVNALLKELEGANR